MENVLIYGAGQGGKHLYEEILQVSDSYKVLAFIDKYSTAESIAIGEEKIKIIRPEQITNYSYDKVFIAVDDNYVKNTLISQYKVPREKINTTAYLSSIAISVRIKALENFKIICDQRGLDGSTAEVGVYQGNFARHINRVFPESKLYLYDTFEGFKSKDLEKEKSNSVMLKYKHYSITAEDLVMDKMPHKEKVLIRKGLFPATAIGENDKYVFVNLDADLYAPILSGLKFFYKRLVPGGVIFIHDYFNPGCPGVKQAIDEFRKETNIVIVPLGDYLTIAVPKPF